MRRSFYRLPTFTALALVLALLLSGCSSDASVQSTVAPTATVAVAQEARSEPTQALTATSTPEPAAGSPQTATPPPDPTATATPALTPTPEAPPTPTADIAPEPLVETPRNISIPALGIETAVEWVGLDAEGNMDVPSGYDTTAWFQHGVRPGMVGNAVIAGHLDSRSGPAIFYELDDLQPGDEIKITTSAGEVLTFRVDRMESFDASSAPRYEIFGPDTEPRLNLITCNGVFDPAAGAYNERLVVYSTLVSGSGAAAS